MDRLVLIAVSFTFLFVQLTSGQLSEECDTAESNLYSTSSCFIDIPDNMNLSVICGAQCNTLQNTYFDRCAGEVGNTVDEDRQLYNQACSSECAAALSTMVPAQCIPPESDEDEDTTAEDIRIVCAGECRPVYNNLFAECAGEEASQFYNQLCGGASVLKGLGIFSLLMVSLAATVML